MLLFALHSSVWRWMFTVCVEYFWYNATSEYNFPGSLYKHQLYVPNLIRMCLFHFHSLSLSLSFSLTHSCMFLEFIYVIYFAYNAIFLISSFIYFFHVMRFTIDLAYNSQCLCPNILVNLWISSPFLWLLTSSLYFLTHFAYSYWMVYLLLKNHKLIPNIHFKSIDILLPTSLGPCI